MNVLKVSAKKLCEAAAKIANKEVLSDPELNQIFLSGEIFHADPDRSEMGGLCLSIVPGAIEHLDEEKQIVLHQIGTRAMRIALQQNKQLLGNMIASDMQDGKNYFDRFKYPGGQI